MHVSMDTLYTCYPQSHLMLVPPEILFNALNIELNNISSSTLGRFFFTFIDVADDICQSVTLWIRYIETESESSCFT